jgi:lysophospholipase L1-like esterase
VANITRFIALGDSLTEGLSDKYPDGSYRGWADRVADVLSAIQMNLEYANFAIRGKLLEQVLPNTRLPLALDLIEGLNTLVTFHAGANNVLRPGFEPDQVFSTYRQAVAKSLRTSQRSCFLRLEK